MCEICDFQDDVTDLVDDQVEAGASEVALALGLLMVAGQLLADMQGGAQGQETFGNIAMQVWIEVMHMGEQVTIH